MGGQDAHLFPTTIGANIAVARPDADADEIAAAARTRPARARGSTRCPLGSTPRSASRVRSCPGASANGWPWPGPCWPVPRCSSSTSRPPGWTGRRPAGSSHDVLAATEGATLFYITHRDEELAPFDEVVVIDGDGWSTAPTRR